MTSGKKKLIKVLCILICYAILIPINAAVFEKAANAESSIPFIICLIVSAFFTFKLFKGNLTEKLLPVFGLVLTFLIVGSISLIIGLFVSPFYIGKWISDTIIKSLTSGAVIKKSEEKCSGIKNVDKMSIKELEEIHKALMVYVRKIPSPVPMPGLDEDPTELRKNRNVFLKKKLENGPVFGCITYEDAEKLNRTVVKQIDEKEKNNNLL